jgi:uncharacterized membrane protein (DUF4010 family)
VLPVLPDQEFGPYDAFNPHQTWLMVVLICGLSLAGYVALKFAGRRYGAPLIGLLGGMASSTATTLIYARHGKENANLAPLTVSVILLANLVVQARLAVMGATVAPAILPRLLPVLASGLVLGLVVTVWGWRRTQNGTEAPMPEIRNPTELRASLGFGLLYAAVMFCAAWLQDYAGSKGIFAVALAAGLTDVDAITLTSLRLFNTGRLAAGDAVTTIALAVLANLAFKLGTVYAIGGAALGKRCTVGLAAIALGTLIPLALQA